MVLTGGLPRAGEWPATRAWIAAARGGADLSGLPLGDWLGSAARRGGPGLDAAAALAADLGSIGLAARATPSLQFALLLDALDHEGPHAGAELAIEVRRGLLHAAGGPLDHAVSLLRDTPRRQLALLGRPACAGAVLDRGRELAGDAPEGVEELERRITRAQMLGLILAAELDDPLETLARSAASMERRAEAALGDIVADRARASWEIQRSGLLGSPELVGDLFAPLVIVEALARAGEDPSALLAEVLGAREGRSLCFYRDAPMPHDADDAAIVLCAAAAAPSGAPDEVAARAWRVLELARQPDGAIHTWVDLPEAPVAESADRWIGMDCAGVAGRALSAMALDAVRFDTVRFDDDAIAASAEWLAGRADDDGGYPGAFYPSRTITTSLVLEGLEAARRRGALPAAARAARDRAIVWLLSRSSASGAIGGNALTTSHAVLSLDRAGALPVCAAAEALAHFSTAQRWDGRWPGEGYYVTPKGDGAIAPTRFGSVTTAMTLAASRRASAIALGPRAAG